MRSARASVWWLLTATLGCSTVRSGAQRMGDAHYTPYRGRVTLSALRDPEGGELVGRVEASGSTDIEELVPEFQRRVAVLGGNHGRIDAVRTRVEYRIVPQVIYVPCGRGMVRCPQTTLVEEETSTTTVEGRAFRVERAR